jgi:nicotinate phosphoribosyltransferase
MTTAYSLLDNDLYKFTMMQAVLELFPNTNVTYKFTNRGEQRFNESFIKKLHRVIDFQICPKIPINKEIAWLKNNCRFFKPAFFSFLENYKFSKKEISFSLTPDNNLDLTIDGPWHSAILWEVPLLAAISQTYFEEVEKEYNFTQQRENKQEYVEKTKEKNKILQDNNCFFADFGTRRRRRYSVQDLVVETLVNNNYNKKFVGTSNVHLAIKHNTKAIGTIAHEFIMGVSALKGLRHANYFAMQEWIKIYGGMLGTALTDTYGSDAFFNDFDLVFSKLHDGVRHDSNDPIEFAKKTIEHYKKMKIDPLTKTIIFSDNLNAKKAVEINNFCEGKIKCSFGIGTNFSNDFKDSKPLNIVIKLKSVDGIEVVKLSDEKRKETGDKDALRVAKYTFFGTPLD